MFSECSLLVRPGYRESCSFAVRGRYGGPFSHDGSLSTPPQWAALRPLGRVHAGFPSGRSTNSNVGTCVLSNQPSSVAPHTLQDAWPVWGTRNFVSVRLYSAPQSHWTIVAILGLCPSASRFKPDVRRDQKRPTPRTSGVGLLEDSVCKTPKCRAANFPRKDETSDNRRSMQPQTRNRNRL
jgi:hypothetical protein